MARRQTSLTTIPENRAPARRARPVTKDKPDLLDPSNSLESFFALARSIEEQQRQLVGLSTQALIVLEGERGRLARGLDCDVAQSLTSAMSSLQRIERLATQVGLRKDLQDLSTMVGSALRDVQRIARLLAPPIEEGPSPKQGLLARGRTPEGTDGERDGSRGVSLRMQVDAGGHDRSAGTRGEPAPDVEARGARVLRVLFAEGHVVVRAGLRQLAASEADMRVVGEARDCREAVRMVGELAPDVVVIDLTTPTTDGVESIREIAALPHAPAILALSVHNDQRYLHHLLEAGASGYVLKNAADTDLMTGIRAVAAGGVFLSASAARTLVSPSDDRSQDGSFGADPLSEREREVLRLTAEGYTNQEIGAKLYLSPKTVDTYRARITGKLDLHHRSELIRYALRQGLLTL